MCVCVCVVCILACVVKKIVVVVFFVWLYSEKYNDITINCLRIFVYNSKKKLDIPNTWLSFCFSFQLDIVCFEFIEFFRQVAIEKLYISRLYTFFFIGLLWVYLVFIEVKTHVEFNIMPNFSEML